ncbi:MAG: carbon storage regulator [Isosphaera sp.]|nr:carbon storage regulator [Isosphaera sp.]
MLVLTRKPGESIVIGNGIRITVVNVGPGRVKIGIEAPPSVRIDREEVHARIVQEQNADVLAAVSSGAIGAADQPTLVSADPDTGRLRESERDAADPTPASSIRKYRGAARKPR